ncbi:hypothetical protein [Yoonia sp. F2084L]|nr:hypothetical protein [Yoonia sp. F2084L]
MRQLQPAKQTLAMAEKLAMAQLTICGTFWAFAAAGPTTGFGCS